MSFLASLFSGNGQQQQQPAPAVDQKPTPGNIPAGTGTNNTPPGVDTNNQQQTQKQDDKQNQSPLDQFKDLWKNDPNPDAANAPQGFLNADPQKIMEAASKVDFAKVITPELATRIKAGGEDGFMASMEAMNKMNQASYANSSIAATKIVEAALAKAQEKFTAQIPDLIKKHQVGDSLRTENPALSHPAAQPILTALQQQFTTKFPNATVAEINQMAKDFLVSFATATNPQKPTDETGGGKKGKEEDWMSWLNVQQP